MGWFLRKGFNFGPLRLNLSKSGLGYSFGVKGARIGVGPRGTYVHMGRGGLYYRKTLSPPSREGTPVDVPPPVLQGTPIPSVGVSSLQDSSSDELLQELQEKHSITSLLPIFIVLGLVGLVGLVYLEKPWWAVLISTASVCICLYLLREYDERRKTAIVQYRLDEESGRAFAALNQWLRDLTGSRNIWRIVTQDPALDRKYQAGASNIVGRKPVSVGWGAPPFVRVNLEICSLKIGDQSFYLFPDRILVYEAGRVASVAYESLTISAATTRFIETESVPADSQVVDRTWRYVNKGGGPDRRFANNPEIPIALYGEVQIRSSAGINVILHTSSVNAAKSFAYGMTSYSQDIRPSESVTDAERPASEATELDGPPPAHTWGWTPGPILLAVIAVCALTPTQPSQAPRSMAVATTAAAPTARSRPRAVIPKFRVVSNQVGKPATIVVPTNTSDEQLRDLLALLSDKVKSGALKSVGIKNPSSVVPETKLPTIEAGSIRIYREKTYRQSRISEKADFDAQYAWNRNSEMAMIKKATGYDRAF